MNRLIKYGQRKLLVMSLVMLATVLALIAVAPQSAIAATTELTITKLAADGTTVLGQRNVSYQELKDGQLSDGTPIPVMGDGTTHYYHQGPVFIDDPDEETEQMLRWNQAEDTNWDTKDMGALKGTNVKDLCNLVGGMAEGDTIQIKASDGFTKWFAYENVYEYSDREGPMVVCWYKDGSYPDSGYTDGMRLVWFAEATYKEGPTSIVGLPSGFYHVFGNWDWHEAADPEYWYYYYGGPNELYPTTTGLSVQKVSQLTIYSTQEPPEAPTAAFTAAPTSGTAPLTVEFTDESTGTAPLTYAWDFDNDGVVDSAERNPTYTYDADGTYSVKLTVSNAAGSDEEVKTDYITVNPAPVGPEILLSSNSGIPGVAIFITGSGFDAGTAGTIWFDTNDNGALDDGEPSVGVNTDADGAVPLLTSLTVPSASTGSYTVRADIPGGGGTEAAAVFTITDSGIIVSPTSGNGQISSSITVTGSGFAPNTSFRLFCDKNGNGVFDDGAYRSGTITASGTVSVTSLSWPSSPTGIYNFLLDLNNDNTIEASASICVTPGIKITSPTGVPGTNIGMNIAGFSANATGYVWFDTNGNGVWDEGENQAPVTTSSSGAATSPGLYVPSVVPGPYQVCAEIPASGLKASAVTYTVRGIILNPSSGTAGTSIGITGYGYNPNQTAGRYIWFDTDGDGEWDADESKVDVTTNASGTLSPVSLTAPAVPAGNYNVRAFVYPYPITFAVFTLDDTPPVAAFTAAPTSGTAPLAVEFTDESAGAEPLTYAWDFDNDGVVDSAEQNPTYTYDAAGTYSVKLTVSNAAGSDEEVKTDYITVVEPPAIDVLYEGKVVLSAGETFSVTAYNSGTEYTVNENTPLGALQAAAVAGGFTYDVTDKNYGASGALLLDNVGTYTRKNPGYWYAYVNDVYKDGYNNPAGALNLIELFDGDRVEFYYAAGIDDPADLAAVTAAATAAVKTVAATGVTPTDWTIQLSGAKETTVTRAYFEEGLACPSSGHQVFWTDGDGNVWGGVPLWLLVAMVDDDPDAGPDHFNFNDDFADQHYEVNLISGDGWKATLDSADIARSDGYIVANTLNGEPLPLQTESGKPCWPLHLKGAAVFSGQQVGNIVRIELTSLPEPPAGWTLELIGDVGDIITQEEFEEGLACTGSGHYREWTDKEGNVWSGVPLWVLLGAVDDIETGGHWTFNDDVAADGYSVEVIAGDGFSKTFNGADVARSDDYIVANECNGAPLTGSSGPLRLVGPAVTKDDGSLGGSAVGNIVRIEIPELQTPPAAPGSWNLTLTGKISDVISQAEFEAGLACPNSGHLKEWTDGDGNVWSGIPLWLLTGWVDDRQPHDYNANQAAAGYTILVKAGDGYTKDFASTDAAWSNDYIVANKINGEPLTDSWPLRLVGAGVAKEDGTLSGTSVGNIVEIELTSFQTAQPIPQVRIVKYAEDGTTILDEITVDYLWMERESGLDVIGDGTTVYRFEGITNDPDDLWDAEETYPGGFKIANAVKGTRIRDLCELVNGMGAGTEIVLVAKDGYETRLPYSSIYPDPSVQARQGDAILAWWADGKYVPDYADGMRLFFTPDDYIYGQWDMHETLPENYWHYYYGDGVMYPSCAGLAAKWITEIRVYSIPQGDWTLKLDGRGIGGLDYDVSKTYFEQALACQFGADHKATYTDSQGRVWEGMPLWFLVGFVDDADQHSDNAFNDDLALAGYQAVITAAGGYAVTIDSAAIIRNSDYIVANTLNGAPIPESDSSWPLRLVGPGVSGSTSISQIVRIELVSSAPAAPPALTADTDGNELGRAVDITFIDDAGWRAAITGITVGGSALTSDQYAVTEGNINITADVFTAAGDYEVVVSAIGYSDVTVTQTIIDDGKGELREAINEALELEEGDYTPAGWQALQRTLRTAQVILNLEHAAQAGVDQALARLTAAMAQLVEKPDKTALEAAINAARALNPSEYTPRSWKQVSNALLVAERVLQNENAGQDEVNRAEERLNDALEALVES